MKEQQVTIQTLSLTFIVDAEEWKIEIPKSQTQITNTEQFKLITKHSDNFVPLSVHEKSDVYSFVFTVDSHLKWWSELKSYERNDKLRALSNIAQLYPLLSTRVTFTLHPENIVFDENLTPKLIYRGIRNQLNPYEMTEEDFLKQYKCLIIALFSKKYNFTDLYNGSLEKATDTKFEREVIAKKSFEELLDYVKISFREEQKQMEQKMQLVPKKRFRLFKQMAIWMTALSVIVFSLLFYALFIRMPYQERLLTAHHEFLTNDYNEVIHTLQHENIEKLPYQAKYILAYSYLKVEPLSDREKDSIMKNISLKSDQYYLLYWIYNGLGDFEKSIDTAKYMDDPQLIIYGLIKKTEQVKNDPELSGTERDEEVRELRAELEKYKEEYELMDEETTGIEDPDTVEEEVENEPSEESEMIEERVITDEEDEEDDLKQ